VIGPGAIDSLIGDGLVGDDAVWCETAGIPLLELECLGQLLEERFRDDARDAAGEGFRIGVETRRAGRLSPLITNRPWGGDPIEPEWCRLHGIEVAAIVRLRAEFDGRASGGVAARCGFRVGHGAVAAAEPDEEVTAA
jgi:hypothetical protein